MNNYACISVNLVVKTEDMCRKIPETRYPLKKKLLIKNQLFDLPRYISDLPKGQGHAAQYIDLQAISLPMDSENMVCTVLLTRDDPYITKIP
jgi:hypothetical protein